MSRAKEEYWFKPKHHGYGAVPSNWKGLLATTAFAVFVPLMSAVWILSLTDEQRILGFVMWAFAVGYLAWRFKEFAQKKTDGKWMWRWNGQPYREMLDGETKKE